MQEILNSLPDPMQLNITMGIIAGLFLVLMLVLNSLVFKPLVSVLDERQRRIDEGEKAHQESLATVEGKEAQYREQLHKAQLKAMGEKQSLLKESSMTADQMITEAKEKALAQVQAAMTDLDKQVAAARGTLKDESQVIAREIVSSILSRASSSSSV